jgi:hypothetical protein
MALPGGLDHDQRKWVFARGERENVERRERGRGVGNFAGKEQVPLQPELLDLELVLDAAVL